jgi:hypothetical protein
VELSVDGILETLFPYTRTKELVLIESTLEPTSLKYSSVLPSFSTVKTTILHLCNFINLFN